MKIKYLLITALLFSSLGFSQDKVDMEAMEKIKNEGLNNSQVENIAFNLIDKSGPRLSNSEGYARATNYAVEQLTDWGLINSAAESWGEFGRGWEMNKSYVAMTKPYYMPFIAIPKAWTISTDGEVNGKVMFLEIESEEDFEKYKGKLKGAIIAVKSSGSQDPTFDADALRYTEEQLNEMAAPREEGSGSRWTEEQIAEWRARRALRGKISSFLAEEGVALVLKGTNGMHGTLFTSSPSNYKIDNPSMVSELEMAPEFVNLMSRLVDNGVSVEIEAEVKTTFNDENLEGYNVIAEIEGSDPQLKSEVVMLGGHLDSWHGATGATDNAAGCIVMMEAVRILQATGLKPRRTVRIALWGGEEQGLHGSRGYVKKSFWRFKNYGVEGGTR